MAKCPGMVHAFNPSTGKLRQAELLSSRTARSTSRFQDSQGSKSNAKKFTLTSNALKKKKTGKHYPMEEKSLIPNCINKSTVPSVISK